jgi:GGDEF domain-containing protein
LLKSAASILLDVFLDSEIYRVGGDEFLIIVTNHTEDDFNTLVSSLRTACDNSSKVKLAIGTWYGDKSFDIRTAMHLADERMYADKEAYYKRHPELKYRGKKV